jgi:hypothetical protein
VFDPSGDKVASIDKFSTQLTLLSALRGNYAMGKTDLDGCEFWIKLDKEGQSNVAKLPKKHAATPAPPESTTTTELPNISGDFYVNAAKGQIERPDTPIARITKADIHATIPGIHDTITQHADIETALGDAPAGKIIMDAKVPAQSLMNIASRHAPGQTGTIDISWTMPDLQPVVEELKSAVTLLPDVKITGGEFNQAAHVDIREKDIAVSNRLVFSAQGTRAGQPIKLDKVDVSKADVTIDPTKDSLAALNDLNFNINSPFITVTGGGSSLNKLNIQGQFDLDKLRDQLAQFVDLQDTKIAGKGTLNISSAGDVTSTTKPVNTQIAVNVRGLALTLPGQETPLQVASLDFRTDAAVDLKTNRVETAQINLTTGDGKNTIIDCDITASGVDLGSQNVKHFDVNKLNVTDLATAQQQLDPFVPALGEQGLRITAGQLYTNVSGSIDGKTRTIKFDQGNPLVLSTPGLTLVKETDDGKSIDVLKDETITAKMMGEVSMPPTGPTSASIKKLSIDTQHKIFSVAKSEGTDLTFKMDENSIGGNGTLSLSADVKALKDIAQRMGGQVQVQTGSAGQVTSGRLDATLAISHDKSNPQTILQLDGKVTNISITTYDPKKPISNETVTISFTTVAQDDMKGATAKAKIDSAFASVELKDAQVKDKALEKAQLVLNASDLAKLNAVAVAFLPPSAPTTAPAPVETKKSKKNKAPPPAQPPPSSPIQVTAGSATLTINAARDPSGAPGSIAGISADGLLTIPSATVSGMEIGNLLVPVTMQKGVVRTVYKDKPEGKNKADPATCNGGTLDFGNITCDLSKDVPRLNIVKGQRIIRNVSINPVLGDALGKYVNPVFANSKQAKGLLAVSITDCDNFAIGEKMYTPDSGKLGIVFSLSDMDIANPMGGALVGGILQQFKVPSPASSDADVFRGQIRDGSVSIEKGVATTDITLSLVDPSAVPEGSKKKPEPMPLHFWGDIRLTDLVQSLNATIPTQLVAKFVTSLPFVKVNDPSQILMDAFPKGIPVSVKGTTTNPTFDFGGIGKQFLDGLTKGNPDMLKQEGQGLLNQVLGGKKEKDTKGSK